jgi:NAD(P)-dependent dehydrogenase (short-subunit alcohol dehydrogenase family)
MESIFSLEGKSAVVTGGGTGLGRAMAEAFVRAGARVLITGRREHLLRETAAGMGPACTCLVHDVTAPGAAETLLEYLNATSGVPDILVNNAGVGFKRSVAGTSEEDFLRVLNTNLIAVFNLSRAVAEAMRPGGKGCILLISSLTAFLAVHSAVAYSVAKSGLAGLMRSLVAEYASSGIRCNSIMPGWIETPMLRAVFEGDEARRQKALNRIPVHRLGSPEDVAAAAVFLASDAAAYINGACLPVDGGAVYNL